jgi:uncharacterized membrane protein
LDKTDPANVASRLALLPAAATAAASPSAEYKQEVKEVKEDNSLDIHHASFMVCIGRTIFILKLKLVCLHRNRRMVLDPFSYR